MYSCLKDWCFSASWDPIEGSLKPVWPPYHHSIEGLKIGTLNWFAIMSRDVSLSDSLCHFFHTDRYMFRIITLAWNNLRIAAEYMFSNSFIGNVISYQNWITSIETFSARTCQIKNKIYVPHLFQNKHRTIWLFITDWKLVIKLLNQTKYWFGSQV